MDVEREEEGVKLKGREVRMKGEVEMRPDEAR